VDRFTAKTVDEFLDALASSEPVPGGGSGAGLGGALAAGLLSMVCNLTIGKKGYEDVEEELTAILKRSEEIRAELPDLMQEDVQVFGAVMACYRMPRKTSEQKAARQEAMQKALKDAAQAPLKIAARCSEIVDLCVAAAEKGNKWAVSDAGVSVVLAEASMRGALLNVVINMASIKDEAYVADLQDRVDALTAGKAETKEKVMATVLDAIRG
jgi:methenyltetrahydrofolate cyclohydrolase